MQEQIIGFEVAKLAKNKGFDWEVKTYFDFKKFGIKPVEFFNKIDANNFSYWNSDLNKKVNAGYISAPTQALLQKWLREIYEVHIVIQKVIGNRGTKIESKSYTFEGTPWKTYPTYEEALEAGLFEALKLIKNKN